MSLILKLPLILKEAKQMSDAMVHYNFSEAEMIGTSRDNIFAHGDNLHFMKYLLQEKKMAGKLNLIYIDPPFFSKANYEAEVKVNSAKLDAMPTMKQRAYLDVWEDGMETYLKMLAVRLFLMRTLLSEEGSLWVHLDWHSVHYVKIMLDEIFGAEHFINEIVWQYKSGGVSKKYFARKHDTLLFYGKTNRYYFKPQLEKSYNRDFKAYRFKGVEEFQDHLGWYTMVNMKDVWQINMVGRTSKERTGYATQKPEQLLERILESCTREGDLCADFFGGSCTLAAVADRMNRNWISCDKGNLAAVNGHKRLSKSSANGYMYYTEYLEEKNRNCLEVKISLHEESDSDTINLAVELVAYQPHSDFSFPVDEKHLPVIQKLIDEDSLELIDYWSIDFSYDETNYIPTYVFCKGEGDYKTHCKWDGHHGERIGIRCFDVFGNCSFQVIDLRG